MGLTGSVARCPSVPRAVGGGRRRWSEAGVAGRVQAGKQARLPFRPQALPAHSAVLQQLQRLATAPRGRGRRSRSGGRT